MLRLDERGYGMLRYVRKHMKQKLTTTILQRIPRPLLGAGLLTLVLAVGAFAPRVYATYQDTINNLNQQIAASTKEVERLQAEGDSLANKLGIISAEKNALQMEIDKNEAKKKQLEDEIAANQAKLDKQKATVDNTKSTFLCSVLYPRKLTAIVGLVILAYTW